MAAFRSIICRGRPAAEEVEVLDGNPPNKSPLEGCCTVQNRKFFGLLVLICVGWPLVLYHLLLFKHHFLDAHSRHATAQSAGFLYSGSFGGTGVDTAAGGAVWLHENSLAVHAGGRNAGDGTAEWRTVHTFVGTATASALQETRRQRHELSSPHSTKSHSQAHQDQFVALFTDASYGQPARKDRYYVDVGAHDAVDKSNTYALDVDYGWRGVCVEADERYLRRIASGRTCAIVYGVAGGSSETDVELATHKRRSSGIVGTSIGAETDNMPARSFFDFVKEADVVSRTHTSVPLLQVLQHVQAPPHIDYLSLDVEGAEFFVLNDFPFHTRFNVSILTVERPSEELHSLLTARHQYRFVTVCGNFGDAVYFHTAEAELWTRVPRNRLQNINTLDWVDKHSYVLRGEDPVYNAKTPFESAAAIAAKDNCFERATQWLTNPDVP